MGIEDRLVMIPEDKRLFTRREGGRDFGEEIVASPSSCPCIKLEILWDILGLAVKDNIFMFVAVDIEPNMLLGPSPFHLVQPSICRGDSD